MTLRLVAILLIFFGLLYYFQGPLKQVPQQFADLHSPYVNSFKSIFHDIITATSSSVIGGYKNYVPGANGSASSTSSNTNQNTGSSNSTPSTVEGNSQSIDPLPPVISNAGEGTLSSAGIITDTNAERRKVGLTSLRTNAKLTASAEAKLQDMFQNQYFAHVSPSGENVSNVVTRAGYDYIVVGENLALGLFPSDESVVAAWMASPGHKRNILDSRYQDIGVAVGQGMYQGRRQWLIVQHFGKPLASCPSPSTNLKQAITAQSAELSVLEKKIGEAKTAVDNSVGTDNYWTNVDTYNALVTEYNRNRDELKKDLDSYNASVKAFNECIGA
jgi:uncharacterized protein YkwD